MKKIILFYVIIISLVLTSCTSEIEEQNEVEEIEIIDTIDGVRNTENLNEIQIERLKQILGACENKSEGDSCLIDEFNGMCTEHEQGLSCFSIVRYERVLAERE